MIACTLCGHASATMYEEDLVTCPFEISQTHYSDTYSDLCAAHKFGEILIKDEEDTATFAGAMKYYQDNYLTPLYQDNVSNPNFLAEHGIFGVRQQSECLQNICYQLITQCGDDTTSTLKELTWCQNRAATLLDLTQESLTSTLSQNAARKEQSLLTQKFTAMLTRFGTHFHKHMADDVRQFHRFTNKVTVFVKYPLQ